MSRSCSTSCDNLFSGENVPNQITWYNYCLLDFLFKIFGWSSVMANTIPKKIFFSDL